MSEHAKPTLFISDLHLSSAAPRVAENFFRFLASVAVQARALYILGDLFDYWVGDDDLADPFNQTVAAALAQLGAAGVTLFFMHGNRDFLIGAEFSRASGCRILPDPEIVNLHGVPTLLTHGDFLCSDDIEYQKFRSQVRTSKWQHAFLDKPLEERRNLARAYRAQSEHAKHEKSMAIMDVTMQSVAEAFSIYKVPRIIHGHTHRPAKHDLRVGETARERWVLSDWRATAPYLVQNDEGLRAVEMA
jgi:UDP-2,3-diacylglucosamine hydrolase